MTPHIIDTEGMGRLITSMMEQIKAQQEETGETESTDDEPAMAA
jgi:hypothetical protein